MHFQTWIHYFTANAAHFHRFTFTDPRPLPAVEVARIRTSIQQFQHGESSEGRNLYRYAKNFDSAGYLKAIEPFIREEQDHAMILGRFMDRNGIARIRAHWMDRVFRGLRRAAGLELSISVLLTAEVIAAIYYQALARATSSDDLRRICDRILRDEEMHINFQAHTIGLLQKGRPWLMRKCVRYAHQVLMLGTVLVVWQGHRHVLRVGGFSFVAFFSAVQREFMRADAMIQGRRAIAMVPVG